MVLENVKSNRSIYDEITEPRAMIGHENELHDADVHSNLNATTTSSLGIGKTNGVTTEIEEIDNSDEKSLTEEPESRLKLLFKKHWPKIKIFIHLFLFVFFTAWWISILAQPSHRPHWLIPTCVWGLIMLRLIFWYVDSSICVTIASKIWNPLVLIVHKIVPEKFRPLAAFTVLMAVHLLATFVDKPHDNSARLDRFISFLGYWLCIACFYVSSNNRRKIDWKAVFGGILGQFALGLFILRTAAGHDLFLWIARLAQRFLNFLKVGSTFMFSNDLLYHSGYFAMNVLPAIMFFSATVYVLSYIGWVHWAVQKVSVIFTWGMNLSGIEAIVAAASPFIGSAEASILLKPFLPFATVSELHTMSTFTFSTISGGAIVSYAGLGLNISALLTAAVMSIPLGIALSRLRWPETEKQLTKGGVDLSEYKADESERLYNVVHAFSMGSWTGIMISIAIMTNLICINAFVSMLDLILSWWGGYWHIHNLSLEMIVGYIFYPMTFFLGVSRPDIYKISRLLGIKMIYNEYNAYEELLATEGTSHRSQMLASFVLCSYANLGTLAERIAIMTRLIPERSKDVTRILWSALLSGFMASFLTACFAGCITNNVDDFSVLAT